MLSFLSQLQQCLLTAVGCIYRSALHWADGLDAQVAQVVVSNSQSQTKLFRCISSGQCVQTRQFWAGVRQAGLISFYAQVQ